MSSKTWLLLSIALTIAAAAVAVVQRSAAPLWVFGVVAALQSLLLVLDRIRSYHEGRPTPVRGATLRTELDDYLKKVIEEASLRPPHHPDHFAAETWDQPVRVIPGWNEASGRRANGRPDSGSAHDELQLLWQVADEHNWVVALGDPGYGKSWLLRCHALWLSIFARQDLAQYMKRRKLSLTPVWLRFDDLSMHSDGDGHGHLVEGILRYLDMQHGISPGFAKWLAEQLKNGKAILLLDALDELPREQLPKVQRAVSAAVSRGDVVRLVITSRIAGYSSETFRHSNTHVKLVGFSKHTIRRYVQSWFSGDSSTIRRVMNELRLSPPIADLATVPLMLSFLCRIVQAQETIQPLPSRRSELYQQITRLLMSAEHRPIPQHRSDEEIAARIELLESLAFHYATQPDGWIDRIDGDRLLSSMRRIDPASDAVSAIRELSERDGFLRKLRPSPGGPTQYRFYHHSFHEYFVAAHLARRARERGWSAVEPFVLERLDRSEWGESLIMLAGTLDDPTIYVDALADRITDFGSAVFAGRAAAETRGHATNVRALRQILSQLTRAIVPDGPYRAAAARVLSWLLPRADNAHTNDVRDLLRHPDAPVRASAAHALSGTAHRAALDDLTALLDDVDIVAHAAAMALRGTSERSILQRLVDLVEGQSIRKGQAAADALVGTTDEPILYRLVELLSHARRDVREAAAAALQGTSEPTTIMRLLAMLADTKANNDASLRAAIAAALQGTTDHDGLARLVALLRNPIPSVCRSAALALRDSTDRATVHKLIDLLGDRHEATHTRESAAFALHGTWVRSAHEALFDALATAPYEVRMTAAEALVAIDDPSVWRFIASHLGGRNKGARNALIEALRGRRLDPSLRSHLVRIMDSPIVETQVAVIQLLADNIDPGIQQVLLRSLADRSPTVRSEAIVALQHVPDKAVREAIVTSLKDPSASVRSAAIAALLWEKDPAILVRVVNMLSHSGLSRDVAMTVLRGRDIPEVTRSIIKLVDGRSQPAGTRDAAADLLRTIPTVEANATWTKYTEEKKRLAIEAAERSSMEQYPRNGTER